MTMTDGHSLRDLRRTGAFFGQEAFFGREAFFGQEP
jgi:hypothetical protein